MEAAPHTASMSPRTAAELEAQRFGVVIILYRPGRLVEPILFTFRTAAQADVFLLQYAVTMPVLVLAALAFFLGFHLLSYICFAALLALFIGPVFVWTFRHNSVERSLSPEEASSALSVGSYVGETRIRRRIGRGASAILAPFYILGYLVPLFYAYMGH